MHPTAAVQWPTTAPILDGFARRLPSGPSDGHASVDEGLTAPVPLPMPPNHEKTPHDEAQKTREMALADTQKDYVGDALDALAAANELDPGGAYSTPAVLASMAVRAEKAKTPNYAKPPTAPDERPLIRKNHPLHQGRTGVSLERRGVSTGMTAVSLVTTGVVTGERAVALGMTGVLQSRTVVLRRGTPVVTRETGIDE